jgi:integrase
MGWSVWIERKPSGKFLVRRRHSSGRGMPSKSCSTKSIANAVKKKWLLTLEYKTLGMADPLKPLDEAYQEYLNEMIHRPENTYLTIKRIIPKYLKGKAIVADLTRQSIVDWRTELFQTLRPRTIKNHLRHLSAWLSWMAHQGYLEESPFKNIDVPNPKSEVRDMHDDELIALDKAAKGDLRLMFRIAYTTGMRQANTLSLTGEMIQDGSFLVWTKSQKQHPYPVDPLLVAPLLKNKPRKGPLFPGWSRFKLRHAFDALKAMAGVRKRVTWHSSKHTFIKIALRSGISRPEVQQMVGNLSSQSMDAYTVFEQGGLRARHAQIKFPVGGKLVGRLSGNLKSAGRR